MRVIGTALADEGFEGVEGDRVLERFARHLMAAIDEWQHDGFARLARRYLAYLPAEPGLRHGIDGNGDLLLLRGGAAPRRRAFLPALARADWLDPESGEPCL